MNLVRLGIFGWPSVLLLLTGCGSAHELPEGVKVIPGNYVDEMLNQCSRSAPKKGEDTWMPSASDLQEFEVEVSAKLPSQLDRISRLMPTEREELSGFPSDFHREYIGIVRNGKKYIYGSFGPKHLLVGPDFDAGDGPTRVCDGGPVFFGAEYEVHSKSIAHWGFNGPPW